MQNVNIRPDVFFQYFRHTYWRNILLAPGNAINYLGYYMYPFDVSWNM